MAKIYKFKEQEVRVDNSNNNKPMFVANDVCEILGYKNPWKALKDHCKHVQLLKPNDSLGMKIPPRGINVIPESDVYRLILRSKMPWADEFQDWVCEEVIPEIHHTGAYVHEEEGDTDEMIIAKGRPRSLSSPVQAPTYRMRTEFRTQSYRFESGL